MKKPGDRVGAIKGGDEKNKIVNFFGYGVYLGPQEMPEDKIKDRCIQFGASKEEAEEKAVSLKGYVGQKIQLDNGRIVWGNECWWGLEKDIKARLEQWEADGYKIREIEGRKPNEILSC